MVETNLDKILTSLGSVNKRLDTIESKLEIFRKRMDSIETKFDRKNERFDDFGKKQKLKNKTFTEPLDSKILKKEFNKLAMRMNYTLDQDRKQHLMIDLYSKRLNLLIYGFEDNKAWEAKEQSKAIIDDFLLDVLQIDPAEIHLVDVYRLFRYPILFRDKQAARPIIIKLQNVFEKKKIMDSLPKLKAYNQKRGELATSNFSIFISEHLSKEFQNHKKSLMSKFKEAREENKSTYWKAVDVEYCLFVEDTKIPPFKYLGSLIPIHDNDSTIVVLRFCLIKFLLTNYSYLSYFYSLNLFSSLWVKCTIAD